MTGYRKCAYQLAECENWTNDNLTLGIGRAYVGPTGRNGHRILVEVDEPICRSCLGTNPEPLDPGTYYGDPRTNPSAKPIKVPHISRYAQKPRKLHPGVRP